MARSSCARLSARSSVNSRACVRFMMVSLLAASAVISLRRFLSSSFSLIQVIHVRHPRSPDQPARAAARTSKYARPRFMSAVNPAAFPDFTVGNQTLHRLLQGQQGFAAVIVQALNLEIQIGAFGRDPARHFQLRIEGGARQPAPVAAPPRRCRRGR